MRDGAVKRALTLYFSSEILLSIGIGMVGYAQPFYYKSCGLSDTWIGILFAANSIMAGMAALLGGTIADRVGPSKVFKLATLIIPLGYLLMSGTHQFYMLLLAATISGLGGAMLMCTENVVLSSLIQGRELASVLSKFVAMYTFVMGSGAILSGVLSSHIGYQRTIFIGCAIALVAPIVRYFVRAVDQKADRMFRMPSGKMLAMSVFSMVFGLGVGMFNPFLTLVLKDTFSFANQTTAMVAASSTFMMSLGAFLVSALLRRFKHGRTLSLSFLLGVGITLVMAFTTNSWGFVGLYLARTIVTSIPGSIVDATFLELTNHNEFAQMFGIRVFGNSVGNALGSYSGGALLNHHALTGLLICSAFGILLAYFYLTFLLGRLQKRKIETTYEASETTFTVG